jgi:hypothetical protein
MTSLPFLEFKRFMNLLAPDSYATWRGGIAPGVAKKEVRG